MPLGNTQTMSTMAGPKQTSTTLLRNVRKLDAEINHYKNLLKDAEDVLSYQELEPYRDKVFHAESEKKRYLEDPKFRKEIDKLESRIEGFRWQLPQEKTQTVTSPYPETPATLPISATETKATTSAIKQKPIVSPLLSLNTYAKEEPNYDMIKDLQNGRIRTLRALKKDPFLYGNQGVDEALKRGFIDQKIADMYYDQGEDVARKALGLGPNPNPFVWDEESDKPRATPKGIPDESKLSVRARNYLENNDIHSVEDFLNLTEDQVLQARNTSKGTWKEINDVQKMIGENPDVRKFYETHFKLTGTAKKLEDFIKDLDKEELKKNLGQLVQKPKALDTLKGLGRGIAGAAVRGLAEAPAYEFLNPPSAGPSDVTDPVNRFETGNMSLDDFTQYLKTVAQAPKTKNNFDALQTMMRSFTK